MEPFSLEWAAQCVGGQIRGRTAGTITSVCVDSRQVRPGALFFALQGETADGHQYVAQAFKAGAIAAVVERVVSIGDKEEQDAQIVVPAALRALGDLARHYRRQFAIPIVGITGSVGKTSTKEMIAAVLRTTYKTLASEKNYNNEIGVPLTLFNLERTHEAAVIEMGMRGLGQIDYLAEIVQPTIGVITNIGYSHIELLGSQENIAQAKSELLARLPADGIAIIPGQPGSTAGYTHLPKDDPNVLKFRLPVMDDVLFTYLMSRVPAGCRVITFGLLYRGGTENIIDVSFYPMNDLPDGGVEGVAIVGNVEFPFSLHVTGRHHTKNAQAAFAVALALNVPFASALQALSEWKGAEGRMTVRHTYDNITVLDDCYNASPESIRAALETLGKMAHNGVAILGDMRELGDYAEQAHRSLGLFVIQQHVRLLVTVGASAKFIHEQILQSSNVSNLPSPEWTHFADAPTAASHISEWVKSGDTVLVKGSRAMGMEVIVNALMDKTGQDENINARDRDAHD